MSDRLWRNDAAQYMNDSEYREYKDKIDKYSTAQKDPSILKLTEQYKKIPLPDSNPMDKMLQDVENDKTLPTSVSPSEFSKSVKEAFSQGGKVKDPKKEALKKLRGE